MMPHGVSKVSVCHHKVAVHETVPICIHASKELYGTRELVQCQRIDEKEVRQPEDILG